VQSGRLALLNPIQDVSRSLQVTKNASTYTGRESICECKTSAIAVMDLRILVAPCICIGVAMQVSTR
jgi:hypothetical protein